MITSGGVGSAFDECWQTQSGWVLASLISYLGDIDEAQDALQDAWVTALEHWPVKGIPDNPRAWLMTVARRSAIDRIRRERSARKHQSTLNQKAGDWADWPENSEPVENDMLRLIFTCCHPSLSHEAKVALTLNTICGLSVGEIAQAFLVSKSTMAQRLVRVKRKIKTARIAYIVPDEQQLETRLDAVRATIYLLFNEAYLPRVSNDLYRGTLCDLAIELGKLLHQLHSSPENSGLLALMLLHDSRRRARYNDSEQSYVPLSEQDRDQWDAELITQGKSLLLQALGKRQPGPYQIQAAISAVHAEANAYEATDWQQLLGLYDALLIHLPSPVVRLNRALVIAELCSVADALPLLEQERAELAGYQPWYAAYASIQQRAGLNSKAIEAYEMAVKLSTNQAEQRYLSGQLSKLQSA